MSRVKKAFTRRHRIKWGALGGFLGCGTYLLRYVPDSWPVWLSASLAVLAFVAAGISSVIEPSDAG